MLKLNVYKNQKEIAKTFEVEAYDLMYGTVEDIFNVLDGVTGNETNADLLKVIQDNRTKLNDLLLDVFPDMTKEDLRNIKIKELVPFFLDLFGYVRDSFSTRKN